MEAVGSAIPAAGLRGRVRAVAQPAWWEVAVGVVGVLAAAVAVVVTLRAGFLAYPGWLAVQKADLILGPIGVGLYWHRRRPASRFGPLLIAVGLLNILYIAESSANPTLFTIGLWSESVVFLGTLALILTFPSGRFHFFPEGLIFLFAVLGPQAVSNASSLLSSQAAPGGTISACAAECPANVWVIKNDPSLALQLVEPARWLTIALASATAALLVWRFATGTPPRRRALAIGTPVALLFLATQIFNQVARLYGAPDSHLFEIARWTIAVSRSLLWYGFLFALIAAELFAGRVLRTMVRESVRRPSVRQLEELLRGPLGDPGLRLAFWWPRRDEWTDAEGRAVQPPAKGQMLTEVERDGRRAAAIIHDVQLADDPELLQAAGATALLALENAELQTAWTESLRELNESRARIAAVADEERRHLERDLHDGAQQRLVGVMLGLSLAAREADDDDPTLHERLDTLRAELAQALAELRDLAHGIYPAALAERGIGAALGETVALAGPSVTLVDEGIGRYPAEVESAVYYCCREALQNAVKHAGATATVSVQLGDDDTDLRFEVRDDGAGFELGDGGGDGLRNMRDRVAALEGRLEILSGQGQGTRVSGTVPLRRASATTAMAAMRRHLSSIRDR
jgi:signal transduction histidine kinase